MKQEDIEKSIKDTGQLVLIHGTACSELTENEDNPLAVLTPLQRRFVEAYAALAGSHGAPTNAARYAGYSPTTCAVKGSQLIRQPKILAALRYLTEHKAHASAILAMSTLVDLVKTGNDAIRMKAADKLLGYSGIIVQTIHKHEHMINDNRSDEQIKKAIAEKVQKLGLGEMIDISVAKRPSNNPAGGPKYKRVLVPNKDIMDIDIDSEEIDWVNMEANLK